MLFATLALVLPLWFMHPAPNQALPDAAFRTYGWNLSMAWPLTQNPDQPSPVPGLTEAEWVAKDIVQKGEMGIPSILQMGFLTAHLDTIEARANIGLWAYRLQSDGAMPYIYAVIGIDDANCSYIGFTATDVARRHKITEAIKRNFPNVALRGHVWRISDFAPYGQNRLCGGLDKTQFDFTDETFAVVYDYRHDGTTLCGGTSDDPELNANLIKSDLERFESYTLGTPLAGVPVQMVVQDAYLRESIPNPTQEALIACRFEDAYATLATSVSVLVGFAWQDYSWIGAANSPQMSAAVRWVADRR
jgi:hypothetical protein